MIRRSSRNVLRRGSVRAGALVVALAAVLPVAVPTQSSALCGRAPLPNFCPGFPFLFSSIRTCTLPGTFEFSRIKSGVYEGTMSFYLDAQGMCDFGNVLVPKLRTVHLQGGITGISRQFPCIDNVNVTPPLQFGILETVDGVERDGLWTHPGGSPFPSSVPMSGMLEALDPRQVRGQMSIQTRLFGMCPPSGVANAYFTFNHL
jgi:hypothetical protein